MVTISSKKAWALTFVGALFFFYSFFQTNMMTALQSSVANSFQASSEEIGFISAIYFYASILFILPAGLLLDRFSVRKIMMMNMALIIFGTVMFACSQNLFFIGIARFISGITAAFSLLSCLKLASFVQPPEKMAIASSWIITIGMLGGMLSSPLTQAFAFHWGWRGALFVIATLGVLIAGVLWMVIHLPKEKELQESRSRHGMFESLLLVMNKWQNWCTGLFITFVNIPVAVFGALFGIKFLTGVYHLSETKAASITSMLFFGMMLGSPFFGWLSDLMKTRRLPMIFGSIVCLFLAVLLLYGPSLSVIHLFILFFAIGFTSATQVLGYPVIAESNPPAMTATALGLASILILGLGYGLALPFVGWLLDKVYQNAFLTIPVGIFLGVILSILIKERRSV